jgi:hypothetical protein
MRAFLPRALRVSRCTKLRSLLYPVRLQGVRDFAMRALLPRAVRAQERTTCNHRKGAALYIHNKGIKGIASLKTRNRRKRCRVRRPLLCVCRSLLC